ncbi:hypothetical protein HPP92_002639 [Vanilla planifolia]|uniref:Uncharacterized protein n=1 Tax=Vanilla planifolia TaxID=51239 RepID=A0A835VKS2_VANPL|nr:hypothetical protein HPP92_002639 [Vanilla planifolia]
MELVVSPRSCTREQQKIYQQWFSIADSDGDGRVAGSDALKFFAMSKLPRSDLKQVWAIADSKRQGFLDLHEFVCAMQLISLGQAGTEINQDALNRKDNFLLTNQIWIKCNLQKWMV